MKNVNVKGFNKQAVSEQRASYEAPAIVYEGLISTRAGSNIVTKGEGAVDPAGLFD